MRSFSCFLVIVLLVSLGCKGPEDEQLVSLKTDLAAAKGELSTLKKRVRSLEREMKLLKHSDAPVRPAQYLPAGSEKDDPFLGNSDAPILLMQFSDYESAPCGHFAKETLPKLKAQFIDPGSVKFVLRDYPLESHPQAARAAVLAHCAGEQGKYWVAHELLFASPEKIKAGLFSDLKIGLKELDQDRLQKCFQGQKYQKEIEADLLDGRRLGAKGAPSFFLGKRGESGLYRGVFIRGAQPFGFFKKQIAAFLNP